MFILISLFVRRGPKKVTRSRYEEHNEKDGGSREGEKGTAASFEEFRVSEMGKFGVLSGSGNEPPGIKESSGEETAE